MYNNVYVCWGKLHCTITHLGLTFKYKGIYQNKALYRLSLNCIRMVVGQELSFKACFKRVKGCILF